MNKNAILAVAALGIAAISTTARGTGNHAGGHGEGEAIGKPGDSAKVSRTISVDMSDTMRFSPANFSVKQNKTIRFLVKNSGKVKHEFVLGTEKELKEHYELMKKNPEMEHADPNMVTVARRRAGEGPPREDGPRQRDRTRS